MPPVQDLSQQGISPGMVLYEAFGMLFAFQSSLETTVPILRIARTMKNDFGKQKRLLTNVAHQPHAFHPPVLVHRLHPARGNHPPTMS
jgi:hypothetical protein